MHLMVIGLGGVEWIQLAQDRDRWGAVVNTVINVWVWCRSSRSGAAELVMTGSSVMELYPSMLWTTATSVPNLHKKPNQNYFT
jgi:hypothetical protein